MKTQDLFVLIYSSTWIATWFLAIWVKQYGRELFLTGIFCFFLAIMFVSAKVK